MAKFLGPALILLSCLNLNASEKEPQKRAREAFEAAPPSTLTDFEGIYYGYCADFRYPGNVLATQMYLLKDAKGGTHQHFLMGLGPLPCRIDNEDLDYHSKRIETMLDSEPLLKLVGGEVQTSGEYSSPPKRWATTYRKDIDSISLKSEEEGRATAYCYFDCRVR